MQSKPQLAGLIDRSHNAPVDNYAFVHDLSVTIRVALRYSPFELRIGS